MWVTTGNLPNLIKLNLIFFTVTSIKKKSSSTYAMEL